MDCYNHINLSRYYNFTWVTFESTWPSSSGISELGVSLRHITHGHVVSNLDATIHITNRGENIKYFLPSHSSLESIYMTNGSPMAVKWLSKSFAKSNSSSLCLNIIILVLESLKNLLSVNCLCCDNPIIFEFDKLKVRIWDRVNRLL